MNNSGGSSSNPAMIAQPQPQQPQQQQQNKNFVESLDRSFQHLLLTMERFVTQSPDYKPNDLGTRVEEFEAICDELYLSLESLKQQYLRKISLFQAATDTENRAPQLKDAFSFVTREALQAKEPL
eukprot:TRINITY_DN3910_c0_g1_i2.p1 TRINITY_DN3910_c0_g1~~TRINITY_DN3910_c0_g1_i2.p1  ORF type:complete len:125 (-),score=33.06 TRINITY_DN3910_c0_g1_i2:128-502(-)